MFRKHFFAFEGHGPSRLFEKGDLKYVILDLLKDKPRHGYDIIKEMEERFHGFYSPSAGSVYPTLQLLEDMGYVKSSEQDAKKIYTITEEGKLFLKEREETISKIKSQMHDWWYESHHEDLRDAMYEFRDFARFVARRAHRLDEEKMAKLKDIIARAKREIEAVLGQGK